MFGLTFAPPGLSLVSDDRVAVFPAGASLVFADLDTRAQEFIELNHPISCFAVDGKKRFVAVAGKTGEKPIVEVYEVATKKPRKTFTLTVEAPEAREFVSIAVSPDGKYVAAQAGAPDWTLHVWHFDKPKPIAAFTSSKKPRSRQSSVLGGLGKDGSDTDSASLSATARGSVMGSALTVSSTTGPKSSNEAPPVYQISFHPTDSSRIAVTGQGILHLLQLSTESGVPTLDPLCAALTRSIALKRTDLAAHSFSNDGSLLVLGTSDGRILAYSAAGELVGETQHLVGTPSVARGVKVIVPWTRGVVAGGEGGGVVVYERMDLGGLVGGGEVVNATTTAPETTTTNPSPSSSPPKLASQPPSTPSSRPSSAGPRSKPSTTTPLFRRLKSLSTSSDDIEHTLALSLTQTEDYILLCTDSKQIYRLPLLDHPPDSTSGNQPLHPFHRNQVTSLDLAIRRPLLASCGPDKSVRIWNTADTSPEVVRQFMDDPYALSLHPSGLFLLVGFADKLRLMSVTVDDLRMYQEFPLRGCREVRFSNGGGLFAAVQGTSIHVFNTWSYEPVATFKEHTGKVKSIAWSSDDTSLVSAGFDGGVFVWNPLNAQKIWGSEISSTMYGCAVIAPDGGIWAGGYGDKSLREWRVEGGLREWTLDSNVAAICVSRDSGRLCLGMADGFVMILPLPISGALESAVRSRVCYSAITRLRISADDRDLFVASEDGGVYLISMDASAAAEPRSFPDEQLTTKSDLEESLQALRDLESRIVELNSEHSYALKTRELQANENLRVATDSLHSEIGKLKAANTSLLLDAETRKTAWESRLNDLLSLHAREKAEMEEGYSKKLLDEYARVDELNSALGEAREALEMRMGEAKRGLEETVKRLERVAWERLEKKQDELDEMKAAMERQKVALEAEVAGTRERLNAEIAGLRAAHEAQLLAERNQIVSLKADNGILRKKAQGSQTEIEAHKAEVVKKIEEIKRLQGVIKGLERDVAALHREIRDRDDTIQDKDRHIYELKKKNQELEKFKFVLDYKIQELKDEMEPKEREMQGLQAQARELDQQLEQANRMTYDLDSTLAELKMKLKAQERELNGLRADSARKETLLDRIKFDLGQCARFVDKPKELKGSVVEVYQKYCGGEGNPKADDAIRAADRTIEELKAEAQARGEEQARVMSALRAQIEKEREKSTKEVQLRVKENMRLIQWVGESGVDGMIGLTDLTASNHFSIGQSGSLKDSKASWTTGESVLPAKCSSIYSLRRGGK